MAVRRFDEWGHHPASFAFPALEQAVEAASGGDLAGSFADPFAGSGKAATFVTSRGDRFVGLEAHPLTAQLAQVKLARPGPADDLRRAGAALALRAAKRSRSIGIDSEQPVVRRFIPEAALRELVAFRDGIDEEDPWSEHLRWAVLGAARDVAGREWPYTSPRREPRRRTTTINDLVARRVADMAEDLAVAPRRPGGSVRLADARQAAAWSAIPSGSVAACVSSPPYLNGVSYAEATRLELHFLGWARTWSEMKRAGAHLVASCPQDVRKRRAHEAAEALKRYPATDVAVTSLAVRLQRAQGDRQRPKRYDHLIVSYFADMLAVLDNLHLAMAPGARAAWVVGDSSPYGVYIDTPALLGLAATDVGFEVLDDIHLRDRGERWPGSRPRRARLLAERLLVFRRPAPPAQEPLPGMAQWLAKR
jgi:hypothetical protein